MKTFCFSLISIFFLLLSCKESLGPNEISGSTDVPFAKVGEKSSVWVELGDILPNIHCDFTVVENRGGITITKGHFETDTAFTHKLDTIIGTSSLSPQIKSALRERALRAFQVEVDSSDKNSLKFDFNLKSKITTEGIQDFIHSDGDESKPFTIVKYSGNVGDKWDFTDKEGNHFIREVKYRSNDDDYPIAFGLIKVIKVEETITEGPLKNLLGKITYISNHKYGLVGVEWETVKGEKILFRIYPSNL